MNTEEKVAHIEDEKLKKYPESLLSRLAFSSVSRLAKSDLVKVDFLGPALDKIDGNFDFPATTEEPEEKWSNEACINDETYDEPEEEEKQWYPPEIWARMKLDNWIADYEPIDRWLLTPDFLAAGIPGDGFD